MSPTLKNLSSAPFSMYSVMIMKGLSVQKKESKIGKNTKKYPSKPPKKSPP